MPLLRLIASLLVATLVLVPAGVMAQADVQSVVDAYEAARQRLFALTDVLDAEPVIPGFTLPMQDLFDWEFNP